MNRWALVGLTVMVVTETATLAGIEPFASWNTPIAWTGFIIFADAWVWGARGRSWIRSAPREFAFLALASIPLWLVFEFYNGFIHNWYYVGLPVNTLLRYFGYAWSFATIWPAIFEGAELIAVWRRLPTPVPPAPPASPALPALPASPALPALPALPASPALPAPPALPALPAPPARPATPVPPTLPALPAALSIIAGAAMLAWPLIWPSPYLAAPVWLGFIFLLEPINMRLGAESLYSDFGHGVSSRLTNLIVSGFLCGILWEFWNYWARAKWHYTVPIMEHVKIFEMPLPGYFGFPAFALECFTMYAFVRALMVRVLGLQLSGEGTPRTPRSDARGRPAAGHGYTIAL
jgi:hypothetical protein